MPSLSNLKENINQIQTAMKEKNKHLEESSGNVTTDLAPAR